MSEHMLRELDSILSESPLYKTLSPDEKYSVMRVLAENYSFLKMDKYTTCTPVRTDL